MNIDSILDFLVKITPGIISAFVAAGLAVNKFYKEKSWERREKAYVEIINSLYDIIKYFMVYKEDYGRGTGLSENTEADLYTAYISASSSLAKATDIGSFYISNEANTVLNELRNRVLLNYSEEPMFEIYDSEFQAHQTVLNKFLVIAKKDLKIK